MHLFGYWKLKKHEFIWLLKNWKNMHLFRYWKLKKHAFIWILEIEKTCIYLVIEKLKKTCIYLDIENWKKHAFIWILKIEKNMHLFGYWKLKKRAFIWLLKIWKVVCKHFYLSFRIWCCYGDKIYDYKVYNVNYLQFACYL